MLGKYLNDSDPLIIAEAVEGLRHLGAKDFLNQISELSNHHSPVVRASVLRYKAKLWPEQAFQMLIQAVSDGDFIVRESAIDELAELGRPEAIPHIQPI